MIENLERRDVPATWGIPWPEAQHLTLSFVPDGTSVEGQSSQLFKTLDSQLGAGKWEATILNAFQTWAENSNINIGLVADGGEPLGTTGAAQGEPRFGDIRISAAPLAQGVAAITSPYNPSSGTLSGDMILNSNDNFTSQSGYDLFTVALHEAGHVFGFADSSSPSSFMYNVYQGPQTSLSASAISALQNLYGGPRNINGVDGLLVSSYPSAPVDLTYLLNNPTLSTPMIGDLASTQSADYFQFKAPTTTSAPNGIDIQVATSGISQLIPRIVVTDSTGSVVASASSTSTSDGGISVHLDSMTAGQIYKIRVDGPSDDLDSIGTYQLMIAPTTTTNSAVLSFGQATPITGHGAVGSPPQTAGTSISLMNQVDYYSFVTPSATPNGVTVQLQAYGIGLAAPQISIYNASGTLVGQATAADPQNPLVTVQLSSVKQNAGYIIKVTNGVINAYQFGTYQVSVSYNAAASSPPTVPILQTPWLGGPGLKLSKPDTSVGSAAKLTTPGGYLPGSFYAAIAGIDAASPAQYYDVATPKFLQTGYMTIMVERLGSSGLLPWITVLNKSGSPVPAQILAQSDGVSVVQVPYTAVSDLIIEVTASAASSASASGNYYLNTTFGTVASSLTTLASGTLGPTPANSVNPGTSASLTTPSAELYDFVLIGSTANTQTDATLQMTVTDSSGNIVATLSCLADEAASLNVLLGQGTYSIHVSARSPSGSAIPSLSYQLDGTNLTDPIKVYSSSSGGCSSPQA